MKMNETGVRDTNRCVPDEKEMKRIKELTVAPVKAETSKNSFEKMEGFKQKLADRLDRMKEAKQIETEVKKPDKGTQERKQMGTRENDKAVERMNSGKDISFGWITQGEHECLKIPAKSARLRR